MFDVLYSDCETGKAQQLIEDGLKITKQMAVARESVSPAGSAKRKTLESVGRDDCVCDICKKVCHLFMVSLKFACTQTHIYF